LKKAFGLGAREYIAKDDNLNVADPARVVNASLTDAENRTSKEIAEATYD
jgi:hypothetical protein